MNARFSSPSSPSLGNAQVLRWTLALGISLVLVACGDDDSDNPSDTPDAGADTVGDTSSPDANADVAPDAEPDADPLPDSSVDVETTPDVAPDADVAPDPDVLPDTETDTIPDGSEEPVVCTEEDIRTLADETLNRQSTVATAIVTVERLSDGFRAVVDASVGGPAGAATSSYVYLGLADAAHHDELDDITAADDTTWDIGFKRAEIVLNSGNSGPGTWLVARVEAATYDDIAAPAPASDLWVDDTFITDTCEVLTVGRSSAATAFGVWYNYNPETHAVTAPEATGWVFYNTATHTAWRMQIEDYASGVYTLRWGTLDGSELPVIEEPEECDAEAARAVADTLLARQTTVATSSVTSTADGDATILSIDASVGGTAGAATSSYVYVNLTSGAQVEISDVDAATSTAWDLAFERTNILLNSGDSGPGTWLLARVEADSLEDVAAPAPTDASWTSDSYVDDACEPITIGRGAPSTAFGAWYDYDMVTHQVLPPTGVYWVLYNRTTHAALRVAITAYADGVYGLRVLPLGR